MTKEERKEVYWVTMFEIIAFGLQGEGLCVALNNATSWMPYLFISEMEELLLQQPRDTGNYWFPAGKCIEERLACLSKAIDLCEQK